uniref:Cilia- and flagella-associated protein 91 n=1 Tax=Emiliania huxleyi TaxID=2903 RepID=A0A7S3S7V1_EMIHU|mmetsp:Transcript_20550/g.61205  ORF Transcript_20550/g.61205 Transcript_20550/m.61205 type:complete len:512 (+) Transcript_20550:72-1607(+)
MQTEYESAYCGGGLGRTLPDSAAFGSWVAPAQSRLNQGGDGVRVSGPSRHRYFKRPVLPFLSEQPPEVLLAPLGAAEPPPPSPEPAAREMATQSDYRESEAQTDPFSPEYSLPPGEAPELLALAGLTHVNGQLPATLQTVEAIERARAKRQFEAALPPLTDEASLSLRRKMLSEQETREWAVREAEMREAREAGVAQFDASMRSDAARLEAAWEERVEQLRQLRLTQKDREIAGIQRGRIKALRKLSEARKHAAARVRSKEPRDIVGEYADYGSQVYAPLDRKGLSLTQDKLADRFETRAPQLEDYNGLCELEASLPSSAFEVRVSKPKPAAVVGPAMRAEQRLRNTLDATAEALQRVKHAPDVEREEREVLLSGSPKPPTWLLAVLPLTFPSARPSPPFVPTALTLVIDLSPVNHLTTGGPRPLPRRQARGAAADARAASGRERGGGRRRGGGSPPPPATAARARGTEPDVRGQGAAAGASRRASLRGGVRHGPAQPRAGRGRGGTRGGV